MNERYYEDYEPGEARDTTGRTITDADIVLHGGQTGDLYPHHFDAEWCATQPFGRRIAHSAKMSSSATSNRMTASVCGPSSVRTVLIAMKLKDQINAAASASTCPTKRLRCVCTCGGWVIAAL